MRIVNLSLVSANSLTALNYLGIMGAVALTPVIAMPVLVGSFVDHLHLSEQQSGWYIAVNLAGIALSSLIVALRIHHWQLRTVAIVGFSILLIADALTVVVSNIYWGIVIRFLSGFGSGIAASVVLAAMARLDENSRGYGFFAAYQVLVGSLQLWLFPKLLSQFGFSGMFTVLLAMEFVCLRLAGLFTVYDRLDQTTAAIKLELETLQQPTSMRAIISLGTFGMANAAIWAYVERIGTHIGLTVEEAGAALGLAALLSASGGFLVYFIGARFSRAWMTFIGVTTQGLSLLFLLYTENLIGFFVATLIFNICWSFNLPQFQGTQADIDHAGSVVAAGQFSNMLGLALGPAIVASFISPTHYESAITFSLLFYIISMWLLLPIADRKESPVHEMARAKK